MESPSKIPILPILVEGILTKCGRANGKWQKRRFVLYDRELCYYKADKLQGKINLFDVLYVGLSNEHTNRKYSFQIIRRDRMYLLQAFNQEEMESWISSIRLTLIYLSVCTRPAREEDLELYENLFIKINRIESTILERIRILNSNLQEERIGSKGFNMISEQITKHESVKNSLKEWINLIAVKIYLVSIKKCENTIAIGINKVSRPPQDREHLNLVRNNSLFILTSEGRRWKGISRGLIGLFDPFDVQLFKPNEGLTDKFTVYQNITRNEFPEIIFQKWVRKWINKRGKTKREFFLITTPTLLGFLSKQDTAPYIAINVSDIKSITNAVAETNKQNAFEIRSEGESLIIISEEMEEWIYHLELSRKFASLSIKIPESDRMQKSRKLEELREYIKKRIDKLNIPEKLEKRILKINSLAILKWIENHILSTIARLAFPKTEEENVGLLKKGWCKIIEEVNENEVKIELGDTIEIVKREEVQVIKVRDINEVFSTEIQSIVKNLPLQIGKRKTAIDIAIELLRETEIDENELKMFPVYYKGIISVLDTGKDPQYLKRFGVMRGWFLGFYENPNSFQPLGGIDLRKLDSFQSRELDEGIQLTLKLLGTKPQSLIVNKGWINQFNIFNKFRKVKTLEENINLFKWIENKKEIVKTQIEAINQMPETPLVIINNRDFETELKLLFTWRKKLLSYAARTTILRKEDKRIRAIALVSYSGGESELPFEKYDIMTVLRKPQDGLLGAEFNGIIGVVHAEMVELIRPAPNKPPKKTEPHDLGPLTGPIPISPQDHRDLLPISIKGKVLREVKSTWKWTTLTILGWEASFSRKGFVRTFNLRTLTSVQRWDSHTFGLEFAILVRFSDSENVIALSTEKEMKGWLSAFTLALHFGALIRPLSSQEIEEERPKYIELMRWIEIQIVEVSIKYSNETMEMGDISGLEKISLWLKHLQSWRRFLLTRLCMLTLPGRDRSKMAFVLKTYEGDLQELSVKENDVIIIHEQDGANYKAEDITGRVGIIPCNVLEIVDPLFTSGETTGVPECTLDMLSRKESLQRSMEMFRLWGTDDKTILNFPTYQSGFLSEQGKRKQNWGILRSWILFWFKNEDLGKITRVWDLRTIEYVKREGISSFTFKTHLGITTLVANYPEEREGWMREILGVQNFIEFLSPKKSSEDKEIRISKIKVLLKWIKNRITEVTKEKMDQENLVQLFLTDDPTYVLTLESEISRIEQLLVLLNTWEERVIIRIGLGMKLKQQKLAYSKKPQSLSDSAALSYFIGDWILVRREVNERFFIGSHLNNSEKIGLAVSEDFLFISEENSEDVEYDFSNLIEKGMEKLDTSRPPIYKSGTAHLFEKQGILGSKWIQRWIEARGHELFIYQSREEQSLKQIDLRTNISLVDSSLTPQGLSENVKSNVISIGDQYIGFSSIKDRQDWISTINMIEKFRFLEMVHSTQVHPKHREIRIQNLFEWVQGQVFKHLEKFHKFQSLFHQFTSDSHRQERTTIENEIEITQKKIIHLEKWRDHLLSLLLMIRGKRGVHAFFPKEILNIPKNSLLKILEANPEKSRFENGWVLNESFIKIFPSQPLREDHQDEDSIPYNKLTQLEELLKKTPKLISTLIKIINITDADVLSKSLITICTSIIQSILIDSIETEVSKTLSKETLFRGNSIATKLLTAYAKSIGFNFLKTSLKRTVEEVIELDKPLEVYELKLNEFESIEENQKLISKFSKQLIGDVISALPVCPIAIRNICKILDEKTSLKFPGSRHVLIAGFIFLRFICPAIAVPKMHKITELSPTPNSRRALILISKVIQNIANGTLFDQKSKEMSIFDPLVQEQIPRVLELVDMLVEPVICIEHNNEIYLKINSLNDKVICFKGNSIKEEGELFEIENFKISNIIPEIEIVNVSNSEVDLSLEKIWKLLNQNKEAIYSEIDIFELKELFGD